VNDLKERPLYAQVEQMLADRIRKRRYAPGEMLPTQLALAAETGSSLITVKRALAELARRGLVESTRGRGTVVRRPTVITDERGGISSWTDSIAGLGAEPRTAWAKVTRRVPPSRIARLLKLKVRQETVRITRLRLVDDEPICLMHNELPLHLAADLPDTGLRDESLYADLERRYGLRAATAEEEVTARPSTAAERAALGDDVALVLVVQRQTFLASGEPLELADIVAPANRYRYRVQLTAKAKK